MKANKMPNNPTEQAFAPLIADLGFYPVLPDAQWVAQVLQWGVRTVQLRFKPKEHSAADIAQQVRAAVAAGRAVAGAQVFVNDHWQLAMDAGAYGVHLGQEDWAALDDAQRQTLRASGMRLGLSTHTPEELTLAHTAQPSYLAIGPVFPTTLKVMPYAPVGLQRLQHWVPLAAPYPVVAIGGIALGQLAAVMACGVSGVAVVSAVTQAAEPQHAAGMGMQLVAQAMAARVPAKSSSKSIEVAPNSEL
jgi:thiamine-phosphate diphosphorylase